MKILIKNKIIMSKQPLMWPWVGRWWMPLSLTLLPVIMVACILPHQINVNNNIVSAVFSFLVVAYVYIAFFVFMRQVIMNDQNLLQSQELLYAIIDFVMSLFMALGCLAFGIVVLRGNTVDFTGISPTSRGYDLYWTYCLSNSITFFVSAGTTNVVATSALSVLWSNASSVTGSFTTLIILGLIINRYKYRKSRYPIGGKHQANNFYDHRRRRTTELPVLKQIKG